MKHFLVSPLQASTLSLKAANPPDGSNMAELASEIENIVKHKSVSYHLIIPELSYQYLYIISWGSNMMEEIVDVSVNFSGNLH